MRRIALITTAVLMLLSAAHSFAQNEDGALSISLKSAQDYAVEHNKTLKNSSLDIRKAEAAKWGAIASMLPQVSASLGYSNYCGYEMNLGPMSMSMPATGTLGITASVALTGQQIIGIQMAEMSKTLADITTQQSEDEIRYQVAKIYMSILVMQNTTELLERSLENLESLQETTQNAVDVGAAEQTDADKLMVQVLSLRTSISSTNRSLEMLENSMRLQLGCGVNTKLTLTQTVDDILKPEAILALQNETFNVENNYNYQLLQENSKLLKKQIDLKIMGYVPTLSAYYQYSGRTYFGKKEGFNMTPPNLIGLTLNVPIWSSGKTWSDVKQAKIEYEKFQNTIETTRDALLVQERQLRYNVTSNYETYEAQKLNLEVTERVFTNVSNKFEHGMASSLELTTASSDIISAQSNYISAVLNLVNAQIEFEQLLNRK
ncbi:MAG: TolC family protein [Bacteroidales bacterium]|nr:TolC family protein [Bacteroidales bacterium]MBQ1695678.1 TolC family protein [Bacteroidales bacterium]MBQ1719184.1 TolC family protein [Bacteroidales bacterium]MBQ1732360.1 TolC family protein [Bacteroidales bacterium]MBQ2542036.1 TolC family protein [Bacteroidales bacterium]